MAASSVYTKSVRGGAGKSVVKSEITSEIGKVNVGQSASVSNFKQDVNITEPASAKKPPAEEQIIASIQLPAFDQPSNPQPDDDQEEDVSERSSQLFQEGGSEDSLKVKKDIVL